LNWHVLVVAVGLSVLTAVLFGLAPANQATRDLGRREARSTMQGSVARPTVLNGSPPTI